MTTYTIKPLEWVSISDAWVESYTPLGDTWVCECPRGWVIGGILHLPETFKTRVDAIKTAEREYRALLISRALVPV